MTRYRALSRATNLCTTLEAPIHPLPGASGRADAPGNGYMDDSIVDLASIFVVFGPPDALYQGASGVAQGVPTLPTSEPEAEMLLRMIASASRKTQRHYRGATDAIQSAATRQPQGVNWSTTKFQRLKKLH